MSQPTLFDLETPALACEKPTRKNPHGRTGTYAGAQAHWKAGEPVCEKCAEGRKSQLSEYQKGYYLDRRGELIEASRRRYADKREEILDQQKDYYERTKLDQKEYRANYRVENREKFNEWNRQYRSRNPEKGREGLLRKRSRLRALPSDGYSLEDVTRTHGTVCYLCETEVDITLPKGTPMSPEIDHVHPISDPECPGNILSNVRWAHSFCNRSKGAKIVSELTLPFPPPQATTTELPGSPDQAQ